MFTLPHTILIFNISEPFLFTIYTSITVLPHTYFVKILTKTFLYYKLLSSYMTLFKKCYFVCSMIITQHICLKY